MAYQEWLAWFLLVILLILPLFSFLVSLPAMLTTRLRFTMPPNTQIGTPLSLQLDHSCPLPSPMRKCKLRVERPLTDRHWKLKEDALLPTNHSGVLLISVKKARILDYIGLSKLPVRFESRSYQISVRPVPIPVEDLPPLERCADFRWKPKPGGGFSENHELRLYRPGDSIQQIHWKLSAKTGNFILREPMEPIRSRGLLRMNLTGTPQILDQKLGQFLWIGKYLLDHGVHIRFQCLTGLGPEEWNIDTHSQLEQTLDQLMSRSRATAGSVLNRHEASGWQYFIGGGSHEA